MEKRFGAVAVAFALGIAALGCGRDSGGGPISTSVPGDKSLGDLTPGERDQLCMDLTSWAMSGSFNSDRCRASAWLATYLQSVLDTAATDEVLRTMCQGLYDGCAGISVPTTCGAFPANCTTTVSEYNACLGDGAEAVSGVPDCSSVTRAALATEFARITQASSTPACMTAEMKCPGLVSGSN